MTEEEWDTPENKAEWLNRLCSLWLVYNQDDILAARTMQPYKVPLSSPNAARLNEALRRAGSVWPWPQVFDAWLTGELNRNRTAIITVDQQELL